MNTTLRAFLTIALWEGVSYLVLLAIAMPLKYYFDFPMAVKVTGWLHGVLFVAYCVLLVMCWKTYRWSFIRVVLYFIAALLPILPFLIKRRLKTEYSIR